FSSEMGKSGFSVEYETRLLPIDTTWQRTGNIAQVEMDRLSPGSYTLEARIAEGPFTHRETLSLDFTIESPWYRKPLAYLGYFLLFSLIAYGFSSYRTRRLLRKNEKLQIQVNARTKELKASLDNLKTTQKRLVQQEKMAGIGQLTAGIAHEINNPLNFISNNTTALKLDLEDIRPLLSTLEIYLAKPTKSNHEKLLKQAQDADLKELIGELDSLTKGLQNGTERIQKIVQGLSYVSFAEKDRKTRGSIEDPINSALNILTPEVRNGIDIVKDFNSTPPIYFYPGSIAQVFLNLIKNGLQASTPPAEVQIKTYTQANEVFVQIIDTGKGIPKEKLSRIFEPFYTTKEVGEGTGLGLSISYGIVENHGGRLMIESEENVGTVATIRLPINLNDSRESAPESQV
ncbi:MAG: ATP-binding protein, partial [Bacteroidota bacterium]